jgi:hypothetical protein
MDAQTAGIIAAVVVVSIIVAAVVKNRKSASKTGKPSGSGRDVETK